MLRLGCAFVTIALMSSRAIAVEYAGNIALEGRYFFQEGDFGQAQDQLSLALNTEIFHEFESFHTLTFAPFVRIDSADEERSHIDIRELKYLIPADNWELSVGIGKVFWGVTESQNLVDVINQTDEVESPDGEEKLGQPMVHLSLIRDWGLVDLFVLPGFRERTFAGEDGRLRLPLPVASDRVLYESNREDRHVDFALRWSHSFDVWDVGLSYFDGTNRDPEFVFATDENATPTLIPFYSQIRQVGVDVQATLESWLLKFEGINRNGFGETYVAATAGLEYTFFGVMDGRADLGVVAEYLYDDRGERAATPFEDDLFLGLRLAFTDAQSTEALFGFIVDTDTGGLFTSLEASRRLGNQYRLSIEARQFSGLDEADPARAFANDDFLQLELKYFY